MKCTVYWLLLLVCFTNLLACAKLPKYGTTNDYINVNLTAFNAGCPARDVTFSFQNALVRLPNENCSSWLREKIFNLVRAGNKCNVRLYQPDYGMPQIIAIDFGPGKCFAIISKKEKMKAVKSITWDDGSSVGKEFNGILGMDFGNKIDDSKLESLGDGWFVFTPKKKFRSFSEYAIRVAPVSKQVCLIRARVSAEDTMKIGYEKERRFVIKLLEEKYHLRFNKKTSPATIHFIDGNNIKMLAVGKMLDKDGGVMLTIVAVDRELRDIYEKETIRSASSDLDAL